MNDIGQKLYPRYELFKEVIDVFRQGGRTSAVFNDKHLSWKWEWAKEMVEALVEPPWNPALMSEAARLQLGML